MSESSPALAELQRWFFEALVRPEEATGCEQRLSDSPQLSARARLGIYPRSYLLRLQKCLAEQFPALCHTLGEPLFAEFAREYLRAHPSASHSLYGLGDGLEAWLRANRPDADRPPAEREAWVDFMIDLARYEHTLFRLYDAPGHEGQPWPTPEVDDAQLVLQPCFALVHTRFPVAGYYHQIRQGHSPPLPPQAEAWVAIARKDYLSASFPITRVHHRFLAEVQRRQDVPAALAEVARAEGQPRSQVEHSWRTRVRRAWLEAGFFVERKPARGS